VDPDGNDAPPGSEGELCIAGSSVMAGYWGRPELTEAAFLPGPGERWYRTGDLVVEGADGEFTFRGRRDRMIKRHGNRVELGEIEACLHAHPDVREAAVVALRGDDGVMRVQAHLATRDGGRLSIIKLKQYCSERIPVYMIPDGFTFHEALPKTSTDKTDYQGLAALG
jgi:acyl-CoA synthetase (AMP-forming)/AMP-acid ligase II